ncbi:M16 family metallopeptidase [Moraxella canis]|uniref:M16 family metallopeptidase n=1 Tax=Moraxella canis TaxID=90239 RepID=UPI000667D149|nr:pitrilysin family protein [Moraxella canis]
MKALIKHSLAAAISSTLVIFSPSVQANMAHDHTPTSSELRLADDSIIDSINQLGDLSVHIPKTHYFQTDNGVTVAFTPLHELPIVDVDLHFFAGSAYDDKAGTANMVATMLIQGTQTLSEDEFIAAKEQLGVILLSNASKDGLSLSLRSLSDPSTITQAADLMVDALANPAFDDKVLERNKQRLMVSLKQQKQNPAYVAGLAYHQAVYGDHPYAHAVTGDEKTLDAMSRNDLISFWRTFINANNATVIITGDMDIESAKTFANRLTSHVPAGKSFKDALTVVKPGQAKHIHIPHDSSQTQVIIGHIADKEQNDASSRQAFSDFALGNEILAGGDFNARLMKTIREQKGYTYGIYGSMERLKAGGSYMVKFSTDGDKAADAIKDTLQIITQSLADGVTHEELELVRLGNKNGFANLFSSNASIHSTVSSLVVSQYPKDHIHTRLERLDSATIDSVNAALRQRIKPDEFIIITVGKTKPNLDK